MHSVQMCTLIYLQMCIFILYVRTYVRTRKIFKQPDLVCCMMWHCMWSVAPSGSEGLHCQKYLLRSTIVVDSLVILQPQPLLAVLVLILQCVCV